jgi:hypothetical protein
MHGDDTSLFMCANVSRFPAVQHTENHEQTSLNTHTMKVISAKSGFDISVGVGGFSGSPGWCQGCTTPILFSQKSGSPQLLRSPELVCLKVAPFPELPRPLTRPQQGLKTFIAIYFSRLMPGCQDSCPEKRTPTRGDPPGM